MKKILSISLMTLAALAAVSCSWKEFDEDAGKADKTKTFVENYPIFTDYNGNTINGTEVYLSLGDSYDYTYTCMVAGVDKTAESVFEILNVSGEPVSAIDTSVPGLYYLNYTAATEHGLDTWTSTRTVFVYDPAVTESIEGTYTVDLDKSTRYGAVASIGLTPADWYTYADWVAGYGRVSSVSVSFTELCPGFYKADDLIFGWYDQVRGYGPAYPSLDFKMSGYICLNADNTISLLSSSFGYSYWAKELDHFEGTYDPATGVVNIYVECDDVAYYADVYLVK